MADGKIRNMFGFFDATKEPTVVGGEALPDGNKSVWIIGRGEDCDVIYSLPKVSRHHCRIDYIDSHFYLSDLDSTNGTYLNGKRIARKERLFAGDVIGLGSEDIVFTMELLK